MRDGSLTAPKSFQGARSRPPPTVATRRRSRCTKSCCFPHPRPGVAMSLSRCPRCPRRCERTRGTSTRGRAAQRGWARYFRLGRVVPRRRSRLAPRGRRHSHRRPRRDLCSAVHRFPARRRPVAAGPSFAKRRRSGSTTGDLGSCGLIARVRRRRIRGSPPSTVEFLRHHLTPRWPAPRSRCSCWVRTKRCE